MIFDVTDYGAIGDGITDNTSAIQACINAAISVGFGVIYFPGGHYLISGYLYAIGSTLSLSFMGDTNGCSIIQTTSTTAKMFSLQSWYPMEFHKLSLGSTVTRSSSTIAIEILGDGTHAASHPVVEYCVFDKSGIAIVADAEGYILAHNIITDLGTGMILKNTYNPDQGDGTAFDNYITGPHSATGGAGIQHLSGGGVKIFDNKIQYHEHAIYKDIQGGPTSIMKVHDNSFENQFGSLMYLSNPTGLYTMDLVEINDNEFGNYGGQEALKIDTAGYNHLKFNNNTLKGLTNQKAIDVDYVNDMDIFLNEFMDWSEGVHIGSNCNDVRYGINTFENVTTEYVNNCATAKPMSMTTTTLTAGSSGTYTKPSGVTVIKVKGQAGGGSGAGVAGGTGGRGCAGGGSAGGYFEKTITNPSNTYTYSVGLKGAAPSAGNNAGNDGQDTTFGSMTANKGLGGAIGNFGTALFIGLNVPGGSASGGDENIPGEKGSAPIRLSSTDAKGGNGGNSKLGMGGAGPATEGQGGNPGTGYGSGGSGAKSASSTNRAGGAGADGIIIIEEYY